MYQPLLDTLRKMAHHASAHTVEKGVSAAPVRCVLSCDRHKVVLVLIDCQLMLLDNSAMSNQTLTCSLHDLMFWYRLTLLIHYCTRFSIEKLPLLMVILVMYCCYRKVV